MFDIYTIIFLALAVFISSACAACSANAPAASAHLMTPILRTGDHPARRTGRQGRGAARPRPRYGAKNG